MVNALSNLESEKPCHMKVLNHFVPGCKEPQKNAQIRVCCLAENNVPNLSEIFEAYAKIIQRPIFRSWKPMRY